jgi:hypothetical protein
MGNSPHKINALTLDDTVQKYILGVSDFGDNKFRFLYENPLGTSAFKILKYLETGGQYEDYKLELGDGVAYSFRAKIFVSLGGSVDPSTFGASFILENGINVSVMENLSGSITVNSGN